jgi:Fic family protein
LFDQDLVAINALGRGAPSCLQIFEEIKPVPQTSASQLVATLGISQPTVQSALKKLVEVGILQALGERKRDRVYVYRKYLDILEQGAEPL